MTTTKWPITYQNGNCTVELLSDGSKIRKWPDGEEPRADFPESIDLKITNWCDGGCWHCHERSTTRGSHASLDDVLRVVEGLPRGVEIAIGGGDPLNYPYLEELLLALRERGLVASVTVHMKHLQRHEETLETFRRRNMIHGLGISYDKDSFVPNSLIHENNVIHFIAGVHSPSDADDYISHLDIRKQMARDESGGFDGIFKKMLLLGYKSFGRGASKTFDDMKTAVLEWEYKMPKILRQWGYVAFDTLAVEQLGIYSPGLRWGQFFMGADGEYTMYVDAVKMEYAISSVSPRSPLNGQTARQVFGGMVKHG